MKNQLLFKDDLAMRVEIDRLQKEPPSETTRDLIKAARDLSLPDYELYKRFARRKDKYLRLTSTPDGEDANAEETTVQSIDHPDAPPRVFASINDRCKCDNHLANEGSCDHEIVAKGGYDRRWFLAKHMRRKMSVETGDILLINP